MSSHQLTIEEVKTRKAKIDQRRYLLEREQRELNKDLKRLQEQCPHTNAFPTHPGRECPDCGQVLRHYPVI